MIGAFAPILENDRRGNLVGRRSNVRFGSLADMNACRAEIHLCPLYPKADIHPQIMDCPLCANSGHSSP